MDVYQKKIKTFRKQWPSGVALKYESKGFRFEPDHVHDSLLPISTYYYHWKSFLPCCLSVDGYKPKYCPHETEIMVRW